MNRANGICQKTLIKADKKIRSQSHLRHETFLLSHPLDMKKLTFIKEIDTNHIYKQMKEC